MSNGKKVCTRGDITMVASLLPFALMSVFITVCVDARDHRSPGLQHSPRTNLSNTPRVLFVTALFGEYEKTLKEPAHQTLAADFVAFTDRNDIMSSVWQVRRLPDIILAYQALVLQDGIVGPNKLSNNSSPFMKVWREVRTGCRQQGRQGHWK